MSETPMRPLTIGRLELPGPFVLAPLAGVTDWPFRLLALEHGASLAYTEMISSEGLVRGGSTTLRMLHRPQGEQRFAPQIFGSDPRRMADAAAIVERMGADLIDINMGCPVKKVCRTGAGAALMKDPARIEAIVKAVVERVSVPVSVKLRTGWDAAAINVLEIAQMLEQAGVSAICVHGRTRAQGYSGRADWETISRVKKRAKVPVIGNGDVFSARQAVEKLERYGVDGVMIARGACGNPWIFGQATALIQGRPARLPSREEWLGVISRHLRSLIEYRDGDERRAVRQLRKHLVWYSRGLRGAPAFRAELSAIETAADVQSALLRHFPCDWETEPASWAENEAPPETGLEKAWSC